MLRQLKLFRTSSLARTLAPTLIYSLGLLLSIFTSITYALVTASPDAQGLGTQVTHNSNIYEITGGTRPGNGPNLFHSFGDFSIASAETARFQTTNLIPDATIGNILGRVTGGSPSSIFGTVDSISYYPNANLFLMNPTGILFGPGAQVSVGGMAYFATADYLKFVDGILFKAMPDVASDALLSTYPVTAFGFLDSNPAAITVQGSQLTVANGMGLSLIAGNRGLEYIDPDTGATGFAPVGVTMTGGRLSAPSGQINIVGVASAGEISTGDFMPTSGMVMGNIALSHGAILDVTGDSGGTVRIRSGQFVMDRAVVFADTVGSTDGATPAVSVDVNSLTLTNGAQIISGSRGIGTSGEIVVSAADQVTLSGFDTEPFPGRVRVSFAFESSGLFTGSVAEGSGGGISITTPSLVIENAAQVATLNSGDGSGGSLSMNVASLNLRDGGRISTLGGMNYLTGDIGAGFGQAGAITIAASDTVVLVGTSPVNSSSVIQSQHFGSGISGAITIDASAIRIEDRGLIETRAGFGGPAGDINLTVSDLSATNGGAIVTMGSDLTSSGNISIVASNNIAFSGQSEGIRSGIRNENPEFGGTGNTSITTRTLQLADTARIISDTFIDFVNLPDTPKLTIQASEAVILTTGSDLRVVNFLTDVGSLAVSAPTIMLSDQSAISTTTFLDGNAGMLNIRGGNLTLSSGSLISSSTTDGAGRASDITLTLDGQVRVNGGRIESSSGPFATGDAGKITISAANILVDNGGTISTSTQFTGNAGAIEVNTGTMTLEVGGSVTSSSVNRTVPLFEGEEIPLATGNAGNIQINAGNQFAMTNSSVTTQASQASGGSIKITTTPSGTVQLINSTISASVLDGAGGGGSVNIDPQYVLLQNSQILAQAVQGPGGNITITITNGGLFLPDANSVISASSQFGVNGTVTIQSPNAPASGQIQPLGKTPLQATSLLNQHCASLADGEFSSFTVAGRDSLPTEPGNWLASPLATLNAGMGLGTKTDGVRPVGQSEGREGDIQILSLRQIAPAGFLTQAFAVDWSASCQS